MTTVLLGVPEKKGRDSLADKERVWGMEESKNGGGKRTLIDHGKKLKTDD